MSRFLLVLVLPRVLALVLVACGGSSSVPDASPPGDARVVDAGDQPPHQCALADCEGDWARTCNDDPQTLDCSAFGATCGAFSDAETATPFEWCTCGSIEAGDGFCLDGRYGVTCVGGLGGIADCGAGYVCVARPNGPFGIGCECNNITDGICPGVACSADPDCATCTPNCTGKSCGDNGCGGDCGTCDFGETCTLQGACETTCVPSCAGKQCGNDGCGGSCGTCDGTCTASGQCQGACVPSCAGKTCGSDGCGGSCGTCSDGLSCQTDGSCGCGFFDDVTYTLQLAPQSTFPTGFSFIGVNVTHIKLDGTNGRRDGAFMGFRANDKATLVFRDHGCKPHIRIKRDYALSGKSCVADEILVGRTSITIPAPIINADGSCTAPAL